MSIQRLPGIAYRFVFVWLIDALSILVAAALPIGIHITADSALQFLSVALSVALVIGLLNLIVRPVLLVLTLPLNVLTIGLLNVPINALILALAAWLIPSFEVQGIGAALMGSLIISAVNTFLTSLTTIDDDYEFYQGVVEWLSQRQRVTPAGVAERGIIMVEIDGLSYDRLVHATRRGYMPALRAMLGSGRHRASGVDCGLPSQTSSCQSGILFGDNYDIPAFRWWDKATQRLIVSNRLSDARLLDERLAKGHGLLRGGSSVGNMLSGDAMKSVLTMSTMDPRTLDEGRWRQEDLYLFFLNPYIFTRSLILTIGDLFRELYQGFRDRVTDRQPRINRLEKGYPAIRAATNVFLRDLETFLVALDIIRGMPAIYTSLIGYDEVAHHAGPDSKDAYQTLRGIDAAVRRIQDIIARKAGRPYDLFVLSDHGQSFGATFAQRYGMTLAELVQQAAEGRATVHTTTTAQPDEGSALVLVTELRRLGPLPRQGGVRRRTVDRSLKALEQRLPPDETMRPVEPGGSADEPIHVTVSGNLAHIYLPLSHGRVDLDATHAAYPGMVDLLVNHEGIGFVVAFDNGYPVVLGKAGARDLETGLVTGIDPLAAFGSPELRAGQVRRLAEFPSAGDLIVNSALYPDGTVAAFEELIGSHGGLGGQQTEAFLVHPADMNVPPTSNATDVFAILNGRRGLVKLAEGAPSVVVDAWNGATLARGLSRWRTWLPLAGGAALLNPGAYARVARDPYMTGPALLIAALSVSITAMLAALRAPSLAAFGLVWPIVPGILMVDFFVAFLAGRLLGGHSDNGSAARSIGFAQVTALCALASFVPGLGALALIVGSFLGFVATWIGVTESMRLRGWRVALYPIVGAALLAAVFIVAVAILDSVGITAQALQRFFPGR